MVDYDRAVGTAGTMRIRDTGSTVEFWILCSDPATFVGSYVWSGVVNGVGVGGSITLPSNFGSRMLGSWTVSTSQTVTFHQNATGTSGLGGAADHSANINRTPPATVPPPPTAMQWTPQSATTAFFQWGQNGTGGSPLLSYDIQYSSTADFSADVHTFGEPGGSAGGRTFGGLVPAQRNYARVRAINAVGASGWSNTVSGRQFGGIQVSDGSAWTTYAVDVSDGTTWIRNAAEQSDGSVWKPTG
jgi:hypothetical protein